MKRIIFLVLLMLPSISLAAASEVLVSLLKTAPEKAQKASGQLEEVVELKELGVINSTPDLIADYNHIYIAQEQVPILGAYFLVLDYEYLANYIGCCVNPGIAVVLYVKKGSAGILTVKQFAKENFCSVTPFNEALMKKDIKAAVFDNINKEDVVVLSCKLRNRAND